MCEVTARRPGSDLADLGDDQRLAGLQRLVGGAAEFRRRLHVLEQQQEDIGLAFVEHEVEKVGDFERGLVAGGDDVAEREIAPARAVEEGKAEAAALRDHRDLALAERARRADGAGVLSMAGLKVGQSAASILAKPSVLGPLTAMS